MSESYTVPFSSSPPSTPPATQRAWTNPSDNTLSFSGNFGLSTTPAGPLPSSVRSFTPVGPPPSTVFGSSQPQGQSLFGGADLYKGSEMKDPGSHSEVSPGKKGKSPQRSPKKRRDTLAALSNGNSPKIQSSPQRSLEQYSVDEHYDEDEDGDYVPGSSEEDEDEYSEDENMSGEDDNPDLLNEDDEKYRQDLEARVRTQNNGEAISSPHLELKSSIPYNWMAQANETADSIASRGVKRSRHGAPISQSALYKPGVEFVKQERSGISAIANEISRRLRHTLPEEPDDLILDTEAKITKIYPDETQANSTDEKISQALCVIPDALCKAWQVCCDASKNDPTLEQEYSMGIGPGSTEPAFHKAVYVANLLLKLHHPPLSGSTEPTLMSESRRLQPTSQSLLSSRKEQPYPQILIDWMSVHHNPYFNALAGLKRHQPNPTAHQNFWDILFSVALRGNLSEVILILTNADFAYACTARDDTQHSSGYDKQQISTINQIVKKLVKLLKACPGLAEDNWFVYKHEWALFRQRVRAAYKELIAFAEGGNPDAVPISPSLEASHFGLTSASTQLSRSARRAESRVPWTIYQNVRSFYNLLLGSTSELVSAAQDWLEATIALAIWWDGDDCEHLPKSASPSQSYNLPYKQHTQAIRYIDEEPSLAYRRRLSAAFERVTNESIDDALQIDSSNPVEVAIACIFEDELASVFDLLQAWSLPIACAVLEIASQGGWYESHPRITRSSNVLFDDNDLLVLNYGREQQLLSKDNVLSHYIDFLLSRNEFMHSKTRERREGWDLSLEILGRFDDTSLANHKISGILRGLSVDNDERADKVIELCWGFELTNDACEVAEHYADYIANGTDKYGTALIYYARARNTKKVKDVVNLLISYCLVNSMSYPEATSLDPHLSSLLSRPRDSLMWLANTDPRASEILSTQMSGYATLRKFYDFRDEQVKSVLPILRPVAMKKAAASALLTVISSAAENIRGGLYDENSAAIVPVDALLVLLGEALVFVDQAVRILSLQQILVLLHAMEDLHAVHAFVQSRCVNCLASALTSGNGFATPAAPSNLLRKSVSDLTASSGFSLVGSSMLDSGQHQIKDGQSRGWDWRNGLQPGAGAQDILSMLRIGLARDVSRAWIDREEI